MSAIPLASKLKRDQALRREQMAAMQMAAHQTMRTGAVPSSMMQNARRNRNDDFLTAQEVEMAMEQRKASGSEFRTFFLMFIVAVIAVLTYAKYDVEMALEVPQVETGVGFGEIVEENLEDEAEEGGSSAEYPDDYVPSDAEIKEQEDLEEHFKVLGVEGRFHNEAHYAAAAKKKNSADEAERSGPKVDPDLERRREMWRVKQEVKKARDDHNQAYGTLVACGKACQENHMQVEAAYNALDSILPREVYKTFYGTDSTKKKRWSSPEELKATYEQNKAKIEEEVDESDKDMALAELKDAYDILRSPEARQYYHLYGRKPVESMKRTSARHGGWGQELMLGTYKYRLIFAILDHFSNSWGETIVIGGLICLLLARLPAIISQTMKMQAVLEAQEELDDMTNQDGALESAQ